MRSTTRYSNSETNWHSLNTETLNEKKKINVARVMRFVALDFVLWHKKPPQKCAKKKTKHLLCKISFRCVTWFHVIRMVSLRNSVKNEIRKYPGKWNRPVGKKNSSRSLSHSYIRKHERLASVKPRIKSYTLLIFASAWEIEKNIPPMKKKSNTTQRRKITKKSRPECVM